jgi:hypothetical protein
MAGVTLPPDYFRAAADKYKANPTDRKTWLKGQIQLAEQSLFQYQAELVDLANQAIRAGDGFVTGNQAAVVGGVLAAIPVGFTQVVGGLFLLSSGFFSKLDAKNKTQLFNQIKAVAEARLNEAKQVAAYKESYESELRTIQVTPYILTAILILLIIK